MDIDSSSLIYDEFSSLIGTECTTFDDFDEFLPKTEPIDFLTDHKINQQSFCTIYDNNNFENNNIPNGLTKIETNFNPDEFINYYQQTEENKSIYAERNTPSPTNSSTSSFSTDSNSLPTSNSSTSSSSINQNVISTPSINMLLDTPPISPAENIYNTINNQQQYITPSIGGGSVKLFKGTIIPVSKLPNLDVNNTKQNQSDQKAKPRTIVLSSKDFKNLMERCNNNDKKNMNNSLQKIIVKQNSINKTISLFPKIAPQQQQQNNINSKILPRPDIKMINSIIDEKTLKKQQRMIKNRKSACLSRMKKKDYVASLENKLNVLEKENTDLKVENTSLRCQLDIFTKQCLCNSKRKFSDIITLTSTNNNNRNTLSLNKILMGSTLRKNTAVLLAMIFMVSINFGTINNFLKPQIGIDKLQTSVSSKQSLIGEHYGVRGLLWINDDTNSNSTIKTNNSHIPNALPLQRQLNLNNKNVSKLKICPMYINQTENLRLASELQKWIDTNDYLNLSTSAIIRPFKYPSDYINQKNTEFQTLFKNMNNLDADIYMKKNKKNYFNRNLLRKNKKSTKLNLQKNDIIEDFDKSNPIEVFQPKFDNKYRKLFDEIRRRDDTFYVVSFNTEHILLPASAYNKSSRPKMSLMLPASDTLLNGKFTLMQIDCEVLNTTLVELKEELIPKNLRPKYNTNNNRNVNVPTRTQDKNTTTDQNEQFNLLNKNNFNNFTPPTLVSSKKLLNRIRKHHHQNDVNELSEVEEENDNEFNKKTDNFNHIYKPYFINIHSQASGNIGNITNDVKINNNGKLLP